MFSGFLVVCHANPNKLGIRYSSSLLGVSYENSTSIAVIEAPTFYQPPNSRNLTVLMHSLYKQLKITRILNEELAAINPLHGDHMEIRITGPIRAQPHVLDFPLRKLKANMFHFQECM
uniref:Uncharacterized protein n=1 Tax=Ananas comosus var. bracteatus TaxID=296719 RepID=A0A6V7P4B5_ANACO|nr:unnamed protein product [Ananas comosus var. bracteatus]